MRQKAFGYLNRQALEEYRNIRKSEKNGARITVNSEAAMTYLYLIAVSGEKVPAANQDAYRYFLSKVGANLKDGTMSSKAQSAIILKAVGVQPRRMNSSPLSRNTWYRRMNWVHTLLSRQIRTTGVCYPSLPM